MNIKTCRYRKRNNKSRRTLNNKITRRYKKMKGGDRLIKNKKELKTSWNNRENIFWEVDDGVGDRRYIYSEDLTYAQFEEKIRYYLKQVEKGQKDAYIKIIYK